VNLLLTGIACLVFPGIAILLQIPQTKVALYQLAERKRAKGTKMTKFPWRLYLPFISIIMCVVVGAVGISLLIRAHQEQRGAADASAHQGQQAPTPVAPQPTASQTPPNPRPIERPESKPKRSRASSSPLAPAPTSSPSGGSGGQSVGGVDCTANQGNCAGINNGIQSVEVHESILEKHGSGAINGLHMTGNSISGALPDRSRSLIGTGSSRPASNVTISNNHMCLMGTWDDLLDCVDHDQKSVKEYVQVFMEGLTISLQKEPYDPAYKSQCITDVKVATQKLIDAKDETETIKPPQQNLWADSGSGSRPSV
jgi:hypothetical protein